MARTAIAAVRRVPHPCVLGKGGLSQIETLKSEIRIMAGNEGRSYLWALQWNSFEDPSAYGVYLIRYKDGTALHAGKGNLRERLLSHWNREIPADATQGGHTGPPLRTTSMVSPGL